MIRTEWLRQDEVLAIRPDGEIRDDDFAAVAGVIDPVIGRHGRLEGLLVDARGFEGWDDAHAMLAHMRFVRDHAPKVARIAVTGDQWWLREAPMMEPFLGTPIKVFPAAAADAARDWLLESPAEPATLEFLPETQGPLVAVRISNRLRDADYDRFQKELEARLPDDGGLRVLAVFDEGFRGWTPKACLDDIAMTFSPWRHRFEKLAVVSGPGFVRWCVANLPAALLPYPVKVFAPEEREAALAWLRA